MPSVEVILRTVGRPILDVEKWEAPQVQTSYNSDGRLVVRLIRKPTFVPQETLIVFDQQASENIIRFCQETLQRK